MNAGLSGVLGWAGSPLGRLLGSVSTSADGGPLVWDARTAARIPSVCRAVAIYSNLSKQMPLGDFRGDQPMLPLSPFLARPDPLMTLPPFIQVSVEDYLYHGNTISVVVQRDSSGYPSAVKWIPIEWVEIECTGQPYPDDVTYWVRGVKLDVPRHDITHIKRGIDRDFPWRGVGVVEEHLSTLDRVARENAYLSSTLKDGAVPSVAIIANNPGASQTQLDAGKVKWMEKFAGKREPAILPSGTQVIPLSWSPADAQLDAARRLSLLDVANIFNLDGYWLGAPSGSMTYQSPTPMFNNLRVVSLEGVLLDFESEWSYAWLPYGRNVRFDRLALTRDDLQTTVATLSQATGGQPLMTVPEARVYMKLPITAAQDPKPQGE